MVTQIRGGKKMQVKNYSAELLFCFHFWVFEEITVALTEWQDWGMIGADCLCCCHISVRALFCHMLYNDFGVRKFEFIELVQFTSMFFNSSVISYFLCFRCLSCLQYCKLILVFGNCEVILLQVVFAKFNPFHAIGNRH
jgi:hypothetical protein